jgi:regulator of replication initiation timing
MNLSPADLVTLVGVITAILTAIGAYRKSLAESARSNAETYSLLARAKQEASDAAIKLIYENIGQITDINNETIRQLKEEVKSLKEDVVRLEVSFEQCVKENNQLRIYGSTLVDAVEEMIRTRRQDAVGCQACLSSDQELIKQLEQARRAFQMEKPD